MRRSVRAQYVAAVGVLASLCVVLPPIARAAPGDTVKVWAISRTSSAPRKISAKVEATPKSDKGALMIVSSQIVKGRRQVFTRADFIDVGREVYPHTYGTGAPIPGCLTPAACSGMVGPLGSYTASFDAPSGRSEWFVAAIDLDIKITVKPETPGWRVREIKTGFARLRGEDADATGASAHFTAVEQFRGAQARGGRYGSVAFAAIPCGDLGSGSATLTGGFALGTKDSPLSLTCGTTGKASDFAETTSATTWRLAGDAAGEDGHRTRLAVFDWPKP